MNTASQNRYSTILLLTVFILVALLFSACGGSPEEDQPEAPTAAQEMAAAPQSETQPADSETPVIEDTPVVGEAPAANDQPPTPVSGEGNLLADLGFRPEKDGFSFENYGSGFTDLTPAEVNAIFGDQVCSIKKSEQCVLTPPAEEWMKHENKDMEGGHCFGMSVASLMMFSKTVSPGDYGAETTPQLQIQGNEPLQRLIARVFEYQVFDSVINSTISSTPSDVLDKLIEAFKSGPEMETYTLSVAKADRSGGHAVTPYAVEDRGDGKYAILVYDNNWPLQPREVLVDRNANTWSFLASTNPEEPDALYEGDAQSQTLVLYPTNPGSQQQPCPFCSETAASLSGGKLAVPVQLYNMIYLEGENPTNHAHLLITDPQGRSYGFKDGKFVQEIPGVKSRIVLTGERWKDSREPVYYVPLGTEFTLTIDGSPLKEEDDTDVVMIGPGYYIGIEGVSLDPMQKDTLNLSPDGRRLEYKTDYSEAPTITLGIENSSGPADYEFSATGVDIEPGGGIVMAYDPVKGTMSLTTSGMTGEGEFNLSLTRIDDESEVTFTHDEVVLGPGDILYFYYIKWAGEDSPLEVGVDIGGNGSIDETYTLDDSE